MQISMTDPGLRLGVHVGVSGHGLAGRRHRLGPRVDDGGAGRRAGRADGLDALAAVVWQGSGPVAGLSLVIV